MTEEFCPKCGLALPYRYTRNGLGGLCPRCRRSIEAAIDELVNLFGGDAQVVNSEKSEEVATIMADALPELTIIKDDDESSHIWVTDGEWHYDAKHPKGVNSSEEVIDDE